MRSARLLSTSGLALVILLLSLPGASAHSGNLLSAFGTATVDGVISAGEYGSCITTTQVWWDYTFTICEMNDNTNDYYAFRINDVTFGGDSVSFWFDNAHDGVVSPVTGPTEDVIFIGGSGVFGDDGYRYIGGGLSAGADPIQNGVGAVIFTPGDAWEAGKGYVYEASHPLNSGDSNDYSLSLSSTVGWCLTYEDAADHPGPVSPDAQYPTDCYSTAVSSGAASKYGDILKTGPAFKKGPAGLAPVGGEILAANALPIFAPWLAVIGLVGCVGTVVVVAKKRHA